MDVPKVPPSGAVTWRKGVEQRADARTAQINRAGLDPKTEQLSGGWEDAAERITPSAQTPSSNAEALKDYLATKRPSESYHAEYHPGSKKEKSAADFYPVAFEPSEEDRLSALTPDGAPDKEPPPHHNTDPQPSDLPRGLFLLMAVVMIAAAVAGGTLLFHP
jgi:hypothetical protein